MGEVISTFCNPPQVRSQLIEKSNKQQNYQINVKELQKTKQIDENLSQQIQKQIDQLQDQDSVQQKEFIEDVQIVQQKTITEKDLKELQQQYKDKKISFDETIQNQVADLKNNLQDIPIVQNNKLSMEQFSSIKSTLENNLNDDQQSNTQSKVSSRASKFKKKVQNQDELKKELIESINQDKESYASSKKASLRQQKFKKMSNINNQPKLSEEDL